MKYIDKRIDRMCFSIEIHLFSTNAIMTNKLFVGEELIITL